MTGRLFKSLSRGTVFLKFVTVLMLAAFQMFSFGAAQADDAAQSRIPTVTRLVQVFLGLESSLNQAVQANDAAAMQRMLSDDFEMRVGSSPGMPIPREAWLRRSLAERKTGYNIEQMAVHDHGKTAVVSFLGQRKTGGNLLVVDVWVDSGGVWKLSTRYAAPAGDPGFDVPGWSKDAEVLDKRY